MAQVKISDLSVGDWVEWMGERCKVDLPLLNTVFPHAKIYPAYTSATLHPIPITPEVLEKNGFAFKHKGIEFDHYETNLENGKTLLLSFDRGEHYYLMYEEKGERGLHQIDCPLGAVHQLQHALRLAGTEKEIEL